MASGERRIGTAVTVTRLPVVLAVRAGGGGSSWRFGGFGGALNDLALGIGGIMRAPKIPFCILAASDLVFWKRVFGGAGPPVIVVQID